MKAIYWFRNDLRLIDNPSLNLAIERADEILFVYVHNIANEKNCSWGFKKMGDHRKLFLSQGLKKLNQHLEEYGHLLNIYVDDPVEVLERLVTKHEIDIIFCESIKAFDSLKQVKLLCNKKVNVNSFFHSSLFMENQLPFRINEIPNIFTDFRKAIEVTSTKPNKPLSLPKRIFNILSIFDNGMINFQIQPNNYDKSSFPITDENFMGGEKSGFIYLKDYFQSNKPSSYKVTRNELIGKNFSTKFSPWLSMGFISARQIFLYLEEYEKNITKNESTYWIFFELLWRDYFRFIMLKYENKNINKTEINSSNKSINHNDDKFKLWIEGKTDNKFINAGMKELKQTGFISNRMRQIVASYLINELSCDWRAGAAWFESQLIDYDVNSNYGNWSYISGSGADPRGGRIFNIEKQQKTYDPNFIYQKMWN